jgi:hypothetical protein
VSHGHFDEGGAALTSRLTFLQQPAETNGWDASTSEPFADIKFFDHETGNAITLRLWARTRGDLRELREFIVQRLTS